LRKVHDRHDWNCKINCLFNFLDNIYFQFFSELIKVLLLLININNQDGNRCYKSLP
jgi:hypothetical protein